MYSIKLCSLGLKCSLASFLYSVVVLLFYQMRPSHADAPDPGLTLPTSLVPSSSAATAAVYARTPKTKEDQIDELARYAKEAGLPRGMASYTTVEDKKDRKYKLVITGARSDRIDVESMMGTSSCLPKCDIKYANSQYVRVCDCKTIKYNANGTLANHRFPPYPGSYFDQDTPDAGYPTRGVIWTNDDGWKVIKDAHIIVSAVCFRMPCCPRETNGRRLCEFDVSFLPNWELPTLNITKPKANARTNDSGSRMLTAFSVLVGIAIKGY